MCIRDRPVYGDNAATNFWLIDWYQYQETGERDHVMTTYHNVTDSWYLVIPQEWEGKITISRNDQVIGQREVIFSLWQGEDKEPVPFLSIYRLTGLNRAARSTREEMCIRDRYQPGRFRKEHWPHHRWPGVHG